MKKRNGIPYIHYNRFQGNRLDEDNVDNQTFLKCPQCGKGGLWQKSVKGPNGEIWLKFYEANKKKHICNFTGRERTEDNVHLCKFCNAKFTWKERQKDQKIPWYDAMIGEDGNPHVCAGLLTHRVILGIKAKKKKDPVFRNKVNTAYWTKFEKSCEPKEEDKENK